VRNFLDAKASTGAFGGARKASCSRAFGAQAQTWILVVHAAWCSATSSARRIHDAVAGYHGVIKATIDSIRYYKHVR